MQNNNSEIYAKDPLIIVYGNISEKIEILIFQNLDILRPGADKDVATNET